MGQALDSFILEGVTTTIPFLARVIRHPDFVAGDVDTRFLERESQLLRRRRMKLDVVFAPGRPDARRRPGPHGVRHRHPARHHHDVRGAAPRRQGASFRWPRPRRRCGWRRRSAATDVLLAGEKNCVRIPGFHLGNSPLEMTETAVRGKTLIVTTTNGTKALLAVPGRGGGVRRRGREPHARRREGARGDRARRRRADRLRRPRRRLLARRRLLRRPARRRGAREPEAAPRAQRRGDREPRPGPPLRRSLGAPPHLQPRGPGADPARASATTCSTRPASTPTPCWRISTNAG